MGPEQAPRNHEHHLSPEDAQRLSHEGNERLREHHEANAERAPEKSTPETAHHEVEKVYERNERNQSRAETAAHEEAPKQHRPYSRAARDATFTRVMNDIQPQLRPTSRAFSKVIHAKPVEKSSEVVGATIARPNAILSGAVFAFILTLAVYLIARYFGYPLSGFESIAAFILGWIVGLLYDFFRVMITGKKA